MPSRPPPPPHIRGFTLIELLVALLVLGVALLGLAGLQSVAVQENRSALLRTQATVAAQEMLDRMRANRTEALAPGAPYQTALTQPASTYTPCNSNCTTTAVAGNDLYRWKLGLQQQLPNGQGAISRPATNLFEVTVQWSEQDLASTANGPQREFTPRSITLRSEL